MTQEEARRNAGYTATETTGNAPNIVGQHTKEFNMKALGDDQLQEQLSLFQRLLDQRRNVPVEAQSIASHIGQLQDEIANRTAKQQQQQSQSQVLGILGDGGQDLNAFRQDDPRMRQALEDVFNSNVYSANQNAAKMRGQTIDDLAAVGGSRQPGLLTKVLGDADARNQDTMNTLFGQRAQGRLGLEDTLFNRAQTGLQNQRGYNLSKAGLVQGGSQFGQNFGLQNRQFENTRSQNALQDIFDQQSLTQAGELGRMQADAAKPTFLDNFAKVTGGLGTFAGGVGSAYSAFKPKKVA